MSAGIGTSSRRRLSPRGRKRALNSAPRVLLALWETFPLTHTNADLDGRNSRERATDRHTHTQTADLETWTQICRFLERLTSTLTDIILAFKKA